MKEVCSQGLADRVEFSCVTEHRPVAVSSTTCARSPAYRSGGVPEDPGRAWRTLVPSFSIAPRHGGRTPAGATAPGPQKVHTRSAYWTTYGIQRHGVRVRLKMEDRGTFHVKQGRECGLIGGPHARRATDRWIPRAGGPAWAACDSLRQRRVEAGADGAPRARGPRECLGPTKGRAEVHTTMAWCR